MDLWGLGRWGLERVGTVLNPERIDARFWLATLGGLGETLSLVKLMIGAGLRLWPGRQFAGDDN